MDKPGNGGNVPREAQLLAQVLTPGCVALDAGCGSGRLLPFMLGLNPKSIHAVDRDFGNISAVKEHFSKDDRIHSYLADVSCLHWIDDAAIDVVVAVHSILGVEVGVPGPVEALREICRVLRPGGKVLLISSNPIQLSPDSPGILSRYFKLSESVFMLKGEELFRSYSREWAEHRVREAGLAIDSIVELPTIDVYDEGWLRANIEGQIEEVGLLAEFPLLQAALLKEFAALKEILMPGQCFDIGGDYAILGHKGIS